MKKLLFFIILLGVMVALPAMMPDRSRSKVIIEGYGEGATWQEAKTQALADLACNLYDPWVSVTDDYKKTFKATDDLEELYTEFVHRILIYQEGWVFAPEYEYSETSQGYKCTAWVGDEYARAAIYNVFFISYDFDAAHRAFISEYQTYKSYSALEYYWVEERYYVLQYKAGLTMLMKLIPDYDWEKDPSPNLLKTYTKMLQTYTEDSQRF